MNSPYDGPPPGSEALAAAERPVPRPLVVHVVLGVVLGAGLWAAWLGWDHEASWDRVAHVEQYPYTTLQVLGCALSVGVVTALLAAWRYPVAAAAGVTVGFWTAWSAQAALTDETGLWLVGALMLGFGLVVGTALCAALGWGARRLTGRGDVGGSASALGQR